MKAERSANTITTNRISSIGARSHSRRYENHGLGRDHPAQPKVVLTRGLIGPVPLRETRPIRPRRDDPTQLKVVLTRGLIGSASLRGKCSRSNAFSMVFAKVQISARTCDSCRPPRFPRSEARWADPRKCFRCNGFVTILPKSSKLARTSDVSSFPRARFAMALVTWIRSVPKLH